MSVFTMEKTEGKKLEAVKKWVQEWNSIPTEAVRIILEHEGIYSPLNVPEEDLENMYAYPAAWGTMWTFGDSLDDNWALEHLEELYDLGIIVYQSDSLGIVFGIDGAGYDFYDHHWIPMYNLRDLQWHLNL